MQSQITIYCENEAELREFAQRILSVPSPAVVTVHPNVALADALRNASNTAEQMRNASNTAEQTPGETPVEQPKRKARSDAGKPRGPYKNAEAPQSPASATQSGTATEAAVQTRAPSEASTPQPAAPEQAAKPAAAPAATAPSGTAAAAPAAAEPGKEPTEADARAALARINATVGLAMQGCMDHLKAFGIDRISKLAKSDYARFIAEADAKIAAFKAAKK